jgi:hypothetical protein
MRDARDTWRQLREEFARKLGEKAGIELHVERAWGRTGGGTWVVLPAATDQSKADTWWLGFDEAELRQRRAAGAILLCRKPDGSLLHFGLPASLLLELAPQLSVKRGTHHRQFNVVRRAGRFELTMTGGRSLDITDRQGDLSWLTPSSPVAPTGAPVGQPGGARESLATCGPTAEAPFGGEQRFFARWRGGVLHPLDPPELEEGGHYLVIASRADALPTTTAERRILAMARRVGLPADLAEQHDHYAHGAQRRP